MFAVPFDVRPMARELGLTARTRAPEVRELERARAVAEELLGARDAADFRDALDDLVTRIDDWMLPPIRLTHRTYADAEVSAALGPDLARRYLAAITTIEARAGAESSGPEPTSYREAFYRADLSPFLRLQLCRLAEGMPCHLALLVALAEGRPIAPHVARGIVEGAERSASAIVALDDPSAA